MVNFENVSGRESPDGSFFQQLEKEENDDEDFDACFHQLGKKRRLIANQVQFLEKTFELENKLEPERKLQLAKELGLQPRQVAIWFQNRRARFKTKYKEKGKENLDLENLVQEDQNPIPRVDFDHVKNPHIFHLHNSQFFKFASQKAFFIPKIQIISFFCVNKRIQRGWGSWLKEQTKENCFRRHLGR
ncbi:hypothetical protein UlMin_035537 [Ulmus minor]